MLRKALPGIDEYFLSERITESKDIIRNIAEISELPLFIQFSGGNDSMAMLSLVREVTDRFVCCYMATGLEFKGVIQFVKDICKSLGVELLISNPSMHKGNLFKRIERFQSFPGLIATWCCRDLKLRPQKKMLQAKYGRDKTFYKLEGIRRAESIRRMSIYKNYVDTPIREDSEFPGSYEVFPIINWTNDDIANYLEKKDLKMMKHYKKYGVSGCAFCPFYPADFYRRILRIEPEFVTYKRVIEWENKLNQPSVNGYYFMRDIKREIVQGDIIAAPVENPPVVVSPCTMKLNGEIVLTCSVYGHFFIDGECYRCEAQE